MYTPNLSRSVSAGDVRCHTDNWVDAVQSTDSICERMLSYPDFDPLHVLLQDDLGSSQALLNYCRRGRARRESKSPS